MTKGGIMDELNEEQRQLKEFVQSFIEIGKEEAREYKELVSTWKERPNYVEDEYGCWVKFEPTEEDPELMVVDKDGLPPEVLAEWVHWTIGATGQLYYHPYLKNYASPLPKEIYFKLWYDGENFHHWHELV